MGEFLSKSMELIAVFISGGGLAALFTVKYARKTAEASAMKSVQDVYQETIQDLRSEKEIIKKENIEMREQISHLEKRVKQNSLDIDELKTYKCTMADCKDRKNN